jgi:hypothetical protein
MGRHKRLGTYKYCNFPLLKTTDSYPFYGRGQAHNFSPAVKDRRPATDVEAQRQSLRARVPLFHHRSGSHFLPPTPCLLPSSQETSFFRSGPAERKGCASRPKQPPLTRAGLACWTVFSWLSGRFPVDVSRPCANVGEEYQTHNGARRVEAREHDSGLRR